MRTFTEEEIEAGRSKRGGFTRETLAGWGVPWPPPSGWRNELLGRGNSIPAPAPGTVTKEQIVEIAPCPKCGALVGEPCSIGVDGRPKNHHERMHVAQLVMNARRVNAKDVT